MIRNVRWNPSRVERPVLPVRHALHHPVDDHGDRLLGDLRAVDLGQVRGDLPVRQPLRRQEITISSTPVSRRCLLATIFGSKLESRSRGTESSTGPASVIMVLPQWPLREFPPLRPTGSFFS